jgi:chromosome segregation ATPase
VKSGLDQSLSKELQTNQATAKEMEEKLNSSLATHTELQQKILALKYERDELTEKFNALSETAKQHQANLTILQQRLDVSLKESQTSLLELTAKIKTLSAELTEKNQRITDLQQKLEKILATSNDSTAQKSGAITRLESLLNEKNSALQQNQSKISSLSTQLEDMMNKLNAANNNNEFIAKQLVNREFELLRADDEKKKSAEKLKKFMFDNSTLEQRASKLESELRQALDAVVKREQEKKAMEKQILDLGGRTRDDKLKIQTELANLRFNMNLESERMGRQLDDRTKSLKVAHRVNGELNEKLETLTSAHNLLVDQHTALVLAYNDLQAASQKQTPNQDMKHASQRLFAQQASEKSSKKPNGQMVSPRPKA